MSVLHTILSAAMCVWNLQQKKCHKQYYLRCCNNQQMMMVCERMTTNCFFNSGIHCTKLVNTCRLLAFLSGSLLFQHNVILAEALLSSEVNSIYLTVWLPQWKILIFSPLPSWGKGYISISTHRTWWESKADLFLAGSVGRCVSVQPIRCPGFEFWADRYQFAWELCIFMYYEWQDLTRC